MTFRLTGGIGNQLFTFSAGKYFSGHTGLPVRFNLTDRYIEKSRHLSDIRNLNFNERFENNFFGILTAKKTKIQIKFNRFSGVYNNTYVSDQVGFDSNLINEKSSKKIKGYFQSYKYTDDPNVKPILKSAKIKNPSTYSIELLKDLNPELTISVHIRRGDYISNSKTHGLLTSEYYRNSLNLILNDHNLANLNPKILVFSDDLVAARQIMKNIGIRNEIFFIDNSKLTDEESLLLMSKSKNIVISNSTYSWWGAWLGQDNKLVVAPEKWFKNLDDPIDLIPHSWILAKSYWED